MTESDRDRRSERVVAPPELTPLLAIHFPAESLDVFQLICGKHPETRNVYHPLYRRSCHWRAAGGDGVGLLDVGLLFVHPNVLDFRKARS